jgi:hypothetical protein
MALTFGETFEDITSDPDELKRLLEPETADGLDEEDDELAADPDPGWENPSLGERLKNGAKAAAGGNGLPPKKVTATVRKDVRAKVAMFLQVGASAWAVRDPLCGGAMVQAVPDVSDALTDILCDSPAMVRWLTTGGASMKWLGLAVALQPVAAAVVGHHITHSIGEDQADLQQADWAQYAA